MSRYEQENDPGGGGGEVDDETLDEAWERSAGADDDEPQPWAKASPSTESLAADDSDDD